MSARHLTTLIVFLRLFYALPGYSQSNINSQANTNSQAAGAVPTGPPRLLAASAAVLQGPERDGFVAAHNAARKPLALAPLTWSESLAAVALASLRQQQETLIKQAQDGWAKGQTPLPSHRQDHQYGENIAAWTSSTRHRADHAVALWLREKPAFDLLNAQDTYRVGDERKSPTAPTDPADPPPPPPIVGHYTQIIWRSTRQLGAAQLTFELTDDRTTRRYTAIICNYSPPGNQQGQPPY